jgi:hypothetical protein
MSKQERIPDLPTEALRGRVFNRPWYDWFLWLANKISTLEASSGIPGGVIFTQSDVVLGRVSSGGGAGEEIPFTDQAQQLVAEPSFEGMRETLGLEIGEDVQAWNQYLEDVSGLSLSAGDMLFFDGAQLQRLPIGAEDEALVVSSGLPAWGEATPDGRWEPLTNGDHTSPELIFVNGDVVMAFVEA